MGMMLSLLRALRRRWLLILGLFVLLAIGATAGAYLKRPSYEAHAKVLLNLGGRPISLSRAEVPPAGVAVQTVEAVTTLSEILSSRDLLERLVDDVGMDAFEDAPPSNPILRRALDIIDDGKEWAKGFLIEAQLLEPVSPRAALVSELRERLSIYPVRQSQVIEISFSWTTPSVPPLVLRHLVDIYIERVNALNAQTAEQTVLSEQAEHARLALDDAQERLRALRQETGIVDPVKERETLTDRIEELGPLLGHAAQGGFEGVALGGADGPGAEMAALRRQLNELRIERAGAVAQYSPDSPVVRAVDARMSATEQALSNERAQIEAALIADRERLARVLDAEPRFSEVRRNVDLAAEAYQTYSKAAHDRNVMRLADEELRLKIIDLPAALAPARGTSRFVLLLAGLAVAAMLAYLIGLFVDRLSAAATEVERDDADLDGTQPTPKTARLLHDLDDAPALRASSTKR